MQSVEEKQQTGWHTENAMEISSAQTPTTEAPRGSDLRYELEIGGSQAAPHLRVSPVKHSTFATFLYSWVSLFISSILLNFVVVLALTIRIFGLFFFCFGGSKPRPFQAQEKVRKSIGIGKITRDIAYYAHAVGLDCEEHKVVTEDGFILRVQHIIDRRPETTDPRGTSTPAV
jgi:hypothetical protein